MTTKCVHCGAPITGFWAKLSALAGVKQSLKNPDYCNKCEDQAVSDTPFRGPGGQPAASEPAEVASAPAVELHPEAELPSPPLAVVEPPAEPASSPEVPVEQPPAVEPPTEPAAQA